MYPHFKRTQSESDFKLTGFSLTIKFGFYGVVLALAFVMAPATLLSQEIHEWVDKSGTYKVQAKLVRFDDENVVLLKANGVEINVPLKILSDENREFIDRLSIARKKIGLSVCESDSTNISSAGTTQATSSDPSTKKTFARAISKNGDPQANRHKTQTSQNGPNIAEPQVTIIKLDSTHFLGADLPPVPDPSAMIAELGRSTENQFSVATDQSIPQIRELGAVNAEELKRLPAPFNRISTIANNGDDNKAQYQALLQLETIPSSLANDSLINILHKHAIGPDESMRLSAIVALYRIDPEQCIPFLIRGLDDKRFAIRWQVFELLREANDPRTARPLADRFHSNDRARIGSILESLGHAAEIPMHPYLKHADLEVRVDTIELLGKIGTRNSTEVLEFALEDDSRIVRLASQRALRQIDSRSND